MKLAIFYDHVLEASEQRGLSVREVLKRAKSFGYDALECSMESLSATPELTREMFDSVGMSIAGVYKYFNLGNDPLDDGPAGLINTAVYFKAVQLEWFADNVPGLKICFDTGNFMYADVDERDAFIRLRDRISHLHLKDRTLSGMPGETPKVSVTGVNMFSAPVGSGILHIREILEELKAMGYDGTLGVEHFGAPDMLGYMEKSAQYVRKIWNS